MMNKEDYTILIEKYLDGELLDEELKKFEEEIACNKELVIEIRLQKEIRDALSNKDIFILRKKLDKINNEEIKSRKHRNYALTSMAGCFLIIAIVAICFLFHKTYNNDELYSMYHSHIDAGIHIRGNAEYNNETYFQALRTYDKNQYSEAIKLFNTITDTSQYYISKEYFTGLSYMELQKFDEAIKHFNIVLNNDQNLYVEDATWQMGLCYLKTNQTKQAILQFKKLLDKSLYYQKRASDMLEKTE